MRGLSVDATVKTTLSKCRSVDLHGFDPAAVAGLMDAYAGQNTPLVATLFVLIKIASMPGVHQGCIVLEQVGDVIDFALRMQSVGV